MFTLNETIDAVTVLNKLSVRGLSDAAGGKRYLLELMEITPTAANVKLYVKIVKDKALLRSLAEASGEISDLVITGSGEAEELVERTDRRRADYYNYYSGKTWGAAESYDLCVNTSSLGFEDTAKMLIDFIDLRLKK